MKLLQRLILGLIILAPVVIGILLALPQSNTSSSSIASVGFKKLGLVEVTGVIYESKTVIQELKDHLEDKSIAGILLRVDSPGGATAPSQEIFKAVGDYRKSGKPVVVSMGNVAASGGYYISCPANKIFAAAGTITGSIGVIMSVPVYKELAKKIGVEMETYKAGAFKDMASPYRSPTPQERTMIQGLLDDTHQQFIQDVATAREIPFDTLARIADGRIFTGRQAAQCGLVDTVGGYEEAVSYLRTLTGVGENVKLVNKREASESIREWFIGEAIKMFPQAYRVFSPVGLHCLTVFE